MDRLDGYRKIHRKASESKKCPHLIKWLTSACKAADTHYSPSRFQLEEYCTTKDYRKCPFFLKVNEYETADLVS